MLDLLGAVAQFEYSIIRERQAVVIAKKGGEKGNPNGDCINVGKGVCCIKYLDRLRVKNSMERT